MNSRQNESAKGSLELAPMERVVVWSYIALWTASRYLSSRRTLLAANEKMTQRQNQMVPLQSRGRRRRTTKIWLCPHTLISFISRVEQPKTS